ncbi:hypothetical protein BG006_003807 [Podila minutissima]|uniref:HMG box domain-containing protein n=1 Tax=Podila minutissima TaxID=64525 RepID=A0A9P5SQ32_9FUNG|nr:hypothetical protein BG006_003807 [Podila minutissima]
MDPLQAPSPANGKRVIKKRRKDPLAPKRPSNAFFIFSQQHRQQAREEKKEGNQSELTKFLGQQWKSMPSTEKKGDDGVIVSPKKKGKPGRPPKAAKLAEAAAIEASKTAKSGAQGVPQGNGHTSCNGIGLHVPSTREAAGTEEASSHDEDDTRMEATEDEEEEDEDDDEGGHDHEHDHDDEEEDEEEEEEGRVSGANGTKHVPEIEMTEAEHTNGSPFIQGPAMSSYPKHSSESNNHASSTSPLDTSERTPLISKTSSPQLPQPSPPSYTSHTSSSYVTANNQLDRPPSPANSIATITPSRVATTSPVSTPGPTAHRKSLSTDTLPVSRPQYYGHDDGEGGGSGEDADESCQARLSSSYLSIRELALREFKILLRYSGPVVLTYVLQNSMQLASLVSLGHLGSIELAASSLASMFAAVTCWSVSLGTATALDTLCSQSFTSHHPHTLGLHLQRAILVLMVLFVPIAAIWLSSEHIFLLLGQEPALAQHAAIFLRGLMPGAPAFLIFECVKKYLQAQGNMHASTYVLLICSPINVVLNYALVWNKYVGMGYIGAPIATSISYWNMLTLLLLYIRFVDGYAGWGGWTRDALTGWPAFLKLALPGVLMVCTEWWAFEVMSLAASYLGTVALAAQSIVVQTSGLLYTIPFGVSIAASNRVGNLIGMGDHRSAKVSSHMSILLAILFGMGNSMLLILCKDQWGKLFSEDTEVIGTVAMVLPLVALYQISDGIAGVGGGVLRGVGLQHLGAYLNLIGYYLIAFPAGYLLAFKLGWGLKGLWSACSIALWTVGLGELWVIYSTDWRAETQKCKERNDMLVRRKGLDGDEEEEDDERSLVDSLLVQQ